MSLSGGGWEIISHNREIMERESPQFLFSYITGAPKQFVFKPSLQISNIPF